MDQSFELAFSHEGPDLLRLECAKAGGFERYIYELNNRFKYTTVAKIANEVSLWVEPEDRTLEVDASLPAAQAFFKGALLGINIFHSFLPPHITRQALAVSIGDAHEEESDPRHRQHLIATELVYDSERGLARATGYHDLLSEWEDEACPDVRYQPFFHRGFGFMMRMIEQLEEMERLKDLETFEAELESQPPDGISWDSALEQLLNSEIEE